MSSPAGSFGARAVVVLASFLVLGCGIPEAEEHTGSSGGQPPRLDPAGVVREVTDVSDHMMRLLELPEANVERPLPPERSFCPDGDGSELATVTDLWRATQVPEEDMEAAMDRLHRALSDEGWTVVMFEPNSSDAQSLELRVEKEAEELFAYARFADARTGRLAEGQKSEISVSVFTRCFEDTSKN
ncbi:hypothetical protein [Streptomyces bohaiensis]|uniref:Lipoprotein n=1 Tax=Streptomyces bohaiensis TaxID=1431344 RepID=A0ABX1C4P8_9ACTN|nr:hypothetical protein [Streptomyces bohaiensis]NJQ14177.1 hypothetical protein [Streptomyces bohaiensis]